MANCVSPRSAYIHVPFCRRRCGYCDFAVIIGRDDLFSPFLDALDRELSSVLTPQPVETLYIGGGTPSHLPPPQLAAMCDAVLAWHPLLPGHEWTVEANPEDVTTEKVALLAARGVTRISLGVQSLNDAKLAVLDRGHNRIQALQAIETVRAGGMAVSVDLIFAAPGETLVAWRQDFGDIIAVRPDHVSTYGLTYESGTSFTIRRDRGLLRPADEELERTMYLEAIDALQHAGFEHYEVSNFAQPGQHSRHNEVYWAGREYFAAGPGAARYVDGVRETNHRSTTTWLRRVQAGKSPVADRERLSPERSARERLVLGLRRMRGVRRDEFAAAAGYDVDDLAGPALARMVDQRLLDDDGDSIRLTCAGLLVSDSLWPELI